MIQIDPEYEWILKKFNWTVRPDGYVIAQKYMNGRCRGALLHRAVWILKHGNKPPLIDHINENKQDCRLENLRPASGTLNALNRRKRAKKSDLPMGVVFHKGRPRPFQAQIRRHGKRRSLGYYSAAEEAGAAHRNAKEVLIEFESLLALDGT